MKMPLVSFCVKCYNQADLIRPALEAAFAQTYRPMEIVISDDASKDGSTDVIQSMIDRYRANGGDIPITFVRNQQNLGNLGNWQKCCEVAKGELLIKADGDDISSPERTAEVVKAWVADGKRALVVYHGAEKINGKGVPFGFCMKSVLDYGPVGAVSAYSRKLYESFGDIVVSDKLAGDDTVYGCRARLLGVRPLWIDKILLKYRVGSGVSSGITGYRKFMAKGAKAGLLARHQTLADIDSCRENIAEFQKEMFRNRIRDEISVIENQMRLWQGLNFKERIEAFVALKPTMHGASQRIIHLLLLSGAFSDPVFDGIRLAKYMVDRFRSAVASR